jgi:hypothetical protein
MAGSLAESDAELLARCLFLLPIAYSPLAFFPFCNLQSAIINLQFLCTSTPVFPSFRFGISILNKTETDFLFTLPAS